MFFSRIKILQLTFVRYFLRTVSEKYQNRKKRFTLTFNLNSDVCIMSFYFDFARGLFYLL